MRAAREAARELSAAAAAAAVASVATAAAESCVDNTSALGSGKTEGNKGRSGIVGSGDGMGRDERKRKREATCSSVTRADGGSAAVKREDASTGLGGGGSCDAGSDDEVKFGMRGSEAASNFSHQRGSGNDDADVRFVDLSEEKAAALDAQVTKCILSLSLTQSLKSIQGAVKIDGLVMWEALAGASQSLLQHRKSGYFLEPVDPVALGLNDYRDVVILTHELRSLPVFFIFLQVKEPSDLGTVCSRVQRQGFATLQQASCALFEIFAHFKLLLCAL
jgi:hypothetical protein